jgi:hypothetical protein
VRGLNYGRGKEFLSFPNCPDRLWGRPSLLFNTSLPSTSRLRMSAVIPRFPLCVFVVWTGKTSCLVEHFLAILQLGPRIFKLRRNKTNEMHIQSKVNNIFRISMLVLHVSALYERHLQGPQRILMKLCVCYVISAE